MFAANSRYAKQPIYSVTGPDGRPVSVVTVPLPRPLPLAGYHLRQEGERLDFLAARYLKDATWFWVLCDANNAPVPAALEAHDTVGIPAGRPR